MIESAQMKYSTPINADHRESETKNIFKPVKLGVQQETKNLTHNP